MRQCKDCNIILEDDVRYCPNCGKSVADDAGEPDLRLAALMTSASLHKIRQDWDAAIADATQALGIDPNNADVASLLAGIYEQKGNADEAAVWYRIALDLDPKNSATKARLDRVNAQAAPVREIRRWRWYLVAAGAAVVLVVVTILLTLAAAGPRGRAARSPRASKPRLDAKTAQVRSTATAPAGSITGPTGSEQTGSSASGGISTSRTGGELAIRVKLGQSEKVVTAGARVDDLVADPREGIVTITFSLATNSPVTRSRVLKAAWQVARESFAASSEAKFVTARCVITPGDAATTQIAFVGDIARSSVEAMGDSPTEAQLDQVFTTKWWNPQVR